MKRICYYILMCCLCISGCAKSKDTTAPKLELNKKNIVVGVHEDIDYMSYVASANDDSDGDLKDQVTYNRIDTSHKGEQTITYCVKDQNQNETKQSLRVHVVSFYQNHIYNPQDVKAEVVTNPDDITVLVNKLHQIPQDYKPTDLQPVIDSPSRQLRKEANEAYTKFYQDAKAKGIDIYTISAYREAKQQKEYWTNQVRVRGEEYASQYSAYPRRSEHELGLAIDVSYKQTGDRLNENVENSRIGQLIKSDGYKYGFILRYPKDKVAITNYGYEPWHMRYVGVELAKELHEKQMTLEEYYGEG